MAERAVQSGSELSPEREAVWYQVSLPGQEGVSAPSSFAVRACAKGQIEPALLEYLDTRPNAVPHPDSANGQHIEHAATRGELLGIKAVLGCVREASVAQVAAPYAHHWDAQGLDGVFFLANVAGGTFAEPSTTPSTKSP